MCKISKGGWVVTAKGGMKVILETDSKQAKKGFKANFELIKNQPSGCLSEKIQSADMGGSIMTTGFPFKYPINTECAWFIYSAESRPVMVSMI